MPVAKVKVRPKVRQEIEKRRENLFEVEKMLRGVRKLPKGSTEKLVREDRDSLH